MKSCFVFQLNREEKSGHPVLVMAILFADAIGLRTVLTSFEVKLYMRVFLFGSRIVMWPPFHTDSQRS